MPRMALGKLESSRSRASLDLAKHHVIDVDTREQLPYDFKTVKTPVFTFETQTTKLLTCDYGPAEYRGQMGVERKSKEDAYKSFGQDRERFEQEIIRMADMQYAAVVIEAEWQELFTVPPAYSQRMRPKTILASCIAWSQRYGVHFFAVPGRNFAEQLTYRLIERWVRDRRGA